MSAERGMTEWTANGVDYTINDPNIAEEFDPTKAYHVHDHVYYQGNLYVFVAEHAAGAWNTSHVLLNKVGAELANLWNANDTEATLRLAADNDLKSAITNKDNLVYTLPYTLVPGKYITTGGAIGTADYLSYGEFDVSGLIGQTVAVITYNTSNNIYFAFYDSSDNVITGNVWWISNAGLYVNKDIPVPQNASKMKVTVKSTHVVYLTVIDQYRDKTNNRFSNIEMLMNPMHTWIPVKGTIYTNSGYYSNGVHQAGDYDKSCYFLVKGMEKVTFTYTTSQYYDIYDFVGANDTVLKYERELSTAQERTITLDVPEGAIYLVTNGTNSSGATVSGYIPLRDGFNSITLNPELKKNGYVHANAYYSGYSAGYLMYVYNVDPFKYVTITSKAFQHSKGYALADKEMDLISGETCPVNNLYSYGSSEYQYTEDVSNASYLIVSVARDYEPTVTAYGELVEQERENAGFKKIVWYGSSIPAGGNTGEGNNNAYPARVGKIISANVINKAIGSSSVVCKDPSRISAGNPYGFVNDFELCSRCLTNTIEEMEWVIDHYNDTNVFTYRTVDTMTEELETFIKNCSYENSLLPYLTLANCPDLFVFDHGFNDLTTINNREDNYDKQISLTGTPKNGWYLAGDYHSANFVQSIEFDCTDYDYVMLSGTIGAYFDVYDLFNGETYVSSERNSSTVRTFSNYIIKTTGATKIIISAGSAANVETINVGGLPYGLPDENLYSFRGAMGFLFNKILSFDPHVRIVMIGNYCNDGYLKKVAECQEWVADHWDVPIYKQWEFYGWTDNVISTKWTWSGGYLLLGSTDHDMTIRNCWLADGVHPHSDYSGRALQFMADHIAAWIMNDIWSQYQY